MNKSYKIEVTHSSDAGGYYADVWETVSSTIEHTTEIFPTFREAWRAGQAWIAKQFPDSDEA